MSDVTSILKAAKELISDESRHIKGNLAANKEGFLCNPHSKDAHCFCSMGAVYRVAGIGATPRTTWDYDHLKKESLLVLRKHMQGSVGWFNDTRTHAEVLAAFDAAIEESSK